jgi:hypothetical protein
MAGSDRRMAGLGATHMGVSTRGLGLTGTEHVAVIERLHQELVR